MGKFKQIIIGTCIAAVATGVWDIKRRVDKRDAYFASLPTEIVYATDNSAWAMYERVTKGLPKDKRPIFGEFCKTACIMNDISYDSLDRSFGGKIKKLVLPDYDERSNN